MKKQEIPPKKMKKTGNPSKKMKKTGNLQQQKNEKATNSAEKKMKKQQILPEKNEKDSILERTREKNEKDTFSLFLPLNAYKNFRLLKKMKKTFFRILASGSRNFGFQLNFILALIDVFVDFLGFA